MSLLSQNLSDIRGFFLHDLTGAGFLQSLQSTLMQTASLMLCFEELLY